MMTQNNKEYWVPRNFNYNDTHCLMPTVSILWCVDHVLKMVGLLANDNVICSLNWKGVIAASLSKKVQEYEHDEHRNLIGQSCTPDP